MKTLNECFNELLIDVIKYKAHSTKCRKKKLRKRVDDGTAIPEAGSVPSDSHYTLPTNQDPHYHQIIDSSQGIEVVKLQNIKSKAITRSNKEKHFEKPQYLKQGCVV